MALAGPWVTGCRRGCYPTCYPAYRGAVLGPLDLTGRFLIRPKASEPSTEKQGKDAGAEGASGENQLVSYQVPLDAEPIPAPAKPPAVAPLRLPPELPGADAPPLRLPKPGPAGGDASTLYEPLPRVDPTPLPVAAGDGRSTLTDLQALAMANSPVLSVAAARVEQSRGEAIQAGARPNPRGGYQSDTVGTASSAGYHGIYLSKTFVTWGKLDLAQSAAEVEWVNDRLRLERARFEVASSIRREYFRTLVAREKVRLNRSLAGFMEQIYQTQIQLVTGGEAAAYEPMQLRVLVIQARAAVVRAEQEEVAALRALSAAVGLPATRLPALEGGPDMPAPFVDYDRALAILLAGHTDLTIAQNDVSAAGWRLNLARVKPRPDLDTAVVVQYDDTTNPGAATYNLQVGGEIPVLNRNRGGIIAAQAEVVRAQQGVDQTRNQLIRSLADAYGRYAAARQLAETFQPEALRDQVRTYRGIYERYRNETEGIAFNDVVVAQQTLAVLLTQYLDLLGDQWQSLVDIAELLQVDDIYLLGELCPATPIPDLGLSFERPGRDSEGTPALAFPDSMPRTRLANPAAE
ncbi:TolC family protein [Pirellulimonas nuda]|uniref:TolC family protein n=1 Tax=Pirellulimonas nuda TaxID=2528009 RepID=UPI0018D41F49|nr:TolC family protein [Pirellulimonas nuda]